MSRPTDNLAPFTDFERWWWRHWRTPMCHNCRGGECSACEGTGYEAIPWSELFCSGRV